MTSFVDAEDRLDPIRSRTDRSGDEVAVGAGASLVVVVAAMLAIVLTLLIAGLGTVSAATLDTAPAAETRSAVLLPAAPAGADLALLDAATPARDGLYTLAAPLPKPDKSLAMVLVGGLFLAMSGAVGMVWRGLADAVLGQRRRATRGRSTPPARGRAASPAGAIGRPLVR